MTLPIERTRAVMYTQDFLIDLCDASKTPGVPKRIREQARSLLRHYPSLYHFDTVQRHFDHGLLECPFATKDEFLGELKDRKVIGESNV